MKLTTFGETSLTRTGGSSNGPPILGSGKALGLLIYLASTHNRTSTREHLIDLLWADVHQSSAKHSLRQAVWHLRQRLGSEVLDADSEQIVLAIDLEYDRDLFLNAVHNGEFESAVNLYRGDFLSGFAVPGGARFEQWAGLEAQRLRHLFARAAETVVRSWLAAGRSRQAVRLARRLRDVDVDEESSWRLLLESLLSAGDPLAALAEATELESVLALEGREPEPATADVIGRVRQSSDPSDNGHCEERDQVVSAELVGRARQFAELMQAWLDARAGSGVHVHIVAPPGIGKTRLLSDCYVRFRAMGARAATLRANPGERDIGYALAGDLAAALGAMPGASCVSPGSAQTLVALNPSLSSLYTAARVDNDVRETLRLRTIAINELVGAVAYEAPLIILIDDLHWADSQSRRMLRGMVEKIDSSRVLLVTTTRPAPEGDLETGASRILKLPALTVADVAALLSSIAELPNEKWAEGLPAELNAATGGNPLLVKETLQSSLDLGRLSLKGDRWICNDASALFKELADCSSLHNRVRKLEVGKRELLLLLAIAGTPLTDKTIEATVARPSPTIKTDLELLERRGFVRRVDGQWEVIHDEIATSVLELASEFDIAESHAALGRVLAESGPESDEYALARAARHLAAAEDGPRLSRVYAAWLRLWRARGDRRPALTLAEELLGENAAEQQASKLVKSLPLGVRAASGSMRLVAAAAAMVLLAVAGIGFTLERSERLSASLLIAMDPRAGGSDIQLQYLSSKHATGAASRMTDVECAPCHTHEGFSEVISTGLKATHRPVSDPTPINCRTCHKVDEYGDREIVLETEAPVELASTGEVLDFGRGNLCANCHRPRDTSVPDPHGPDIEINSVEWGPHRSPVAAVVAGTGVVRYRGPEVYPITNPHVAEDQGGCTVCHMADPISDRAGGHQMGLSDSSTGATSIHTGGCELCHAKGQSFARTVDARRQHIDSLVNVLRRSLQQMGILDDSNRVVPGDWRSHSGSALHNYLLITEDAGAYVHNPRFASALLSNTIAALQPPEPMGANRQFVAAGGSHTCALDYSGTASCWGSNSFGQLGNGTNKNSAAPVPVGGGHRFTSVCAGAEHTCGLAESGEVLCWGKNDRGQLGDGTNHHRLRPVRAIGGARWVALSCGGEQTCALDDGHAAYCWGENDRGNLGDATTIGRSAPVPVVGGYSFETVDVEDMFTCGTGDGFTRCWGVNWGGQLGDGTAGMGWLIRTVPTAVLSNTQFSRLGVGRWHACAIDAAGVGYCWGRNDQGQLGIGSTFDRHVPVGVSGGSDYVELDSGEWHTCAVDRRGEMHCWGGNDRGQLGNESRTRRLVPTRVPFAGAFTSVSAGDEHTCGLDDRGFAYCWGANDRGQLGDGTNTDRLSPVATLFDPAQASAPEAGRR